jgi:membrane fusion protein (multidrug efflux system)
MAVDTEDESPDVEEQRKAGAPGAGTETSPAGKQSPTNGKSQSGPAKPDAPKGSGKKPGSRRRMALFIGLGVLILAILIGIPYWLYSREFEDTDDAFLDAHAVEVSPRVSGHVIKVLVKDNAAVKTGDPLVQLDPADFQTQVDEAEARLLAAQDAAAQALTNVELTKKTSLATEIEAKAGIDVASAGVETAKAAIDQAKAQLTANQATAHKAELDLERYQALVKTGDITQQQLDQAQADAATANANVDAAQKAVVSAEASLTEAQQKVIQAQSEYNAANVVQERNAVAEQDYKNAIDQIKELQAALDQQKLYASYTTIYAPFDGRVTLKQVEVGSYVQTGQALMSIVPSDLFVTANFKETQLSRMHPGEAVTVTVDAFPGREFKAHVDSLQQGSGSRFSLLPPENATGNYVKVVQRVPAKIVFDEPLPPEFDFAIGMSVDPKVRVRDGWFQ